MFSRKISSAARQELPKEEPHPCRCAMGECSGKGGSFEGRAALGDSGLGGRSDLGRRGGNRTEKARAPIGLPLFSYFSFGRRCRGFFRSRLFEKSRPKNFYAASRFAFFTLVTFPHRTPQTHGPRSSPGRSDLGRRNGNQPGLVTYPLRGIRSPPLPFFSCKAALFQRPWGFAPNPTSL